MKLEHFHYELPQHAIARFPLEKRSTSRLLCLQQKQMAHQQFRDITQLINPGDLLVFNDTKVINARLFGCKKTGGVIEMLVEKVLDQSRVIAQMRASKAPKLGSDIMIADYCLRVVNKQDGFYELRLLDQQKSVFEMIETQGQLPLPPYLHRLPEKEDEERYQTIYAKHQGSVAAPTAGLHFDQELMQQLAAKQVKFAFLTLHIGAGTFLPVRVNNIQEHHMHAEPFAISAELCEQVAATKAQGKRVIAVGTTSLRALEAASQSGQIAPYSGETNIFIYPGFEFKCVDALITNLHLPASTLLMLVCAFGGHERIMQAYREAIKQNYRFYSYGDAMWVDKA